MSDKSVSPSREGRPWWNWATTSVSALALALSTYLGWHSLRGGHVIGCDGGRPCDQVLSSRWSTIGGVLPVSGLAAGVYLAMLIASLSVGPSGVLAVRQLAWRAMLLLAGAIAGSAVWFIIVQLWLVKAFCPYCMATHLAGLTLSALVFWQAPKRFASTLANAGPPIRRLGAMGAAMAGLLAVIQTNITPPATYLGGESRSNVANAGAPAMPITGPADARYVVRLLFDYECPHCQRLHFMLAEAVRRYHGQLAFALFPTPLNSRCNSYVLQDVEQFKDSCELARVALAVWLANREAFSEFDQWMFLLESGDSWHPRGPDAAKAKAIELVGAEKFDAALVDPRIDQCLQAAVRLYGSTIQGSSAVPKLIFGSRWVVPEPPDADQLVSILQEALMLPKP